tara:strand:- start:167 stop:379 length:213 start_codon:yes stop_codon:yes gene_type:complete
MNLEVGDFATINMVGRKVNVRVLDFIDGWGVLVENPKRNFRNVVQPTELTKINFVTDASKRRFAGQFEGR